MRKNFFGILFLAVIIAVLPVLSIDAQTITIGQDENWYVSYDGKKISTFNVNNDAVQSKISGVQPGDTVDYYVGYYNNSDSDTNWYLSTAIIQSLEQNTDGSSSGASGGAYSYVLTYENDGQTVELYNSNSIGGDNQGLKNIAGDENTFFYIGQLAKGAHGKVKLSVTLDGSTQVNNYMEKMASLKVRFGTEKLSGKPEKIFVPGKDESKINYVPGNSGYETVLKLPNGTEIVTIPDGDLPLSGAVGGGPQTGDDIRLLVICGCGVVAGIALLVWYFILMKKKQQEA